MEQKNDDPMVRMVMAFQALRQGGGESTIQEHEQISMRTRVTMPLMHALLVSASFVMVIGGLGLFVGSAAGALGWDVAPGQVLIAGLTVVAIGVGVWALVRSVWRLRWGIGQVVMALFVALFVGVAALSAAASMEARLGWWDLAWMVVGASLLLGGVALFYNQSLDLVVPYWRQSPFEKAIMELLPDLFGVPGQGAAGAATGTRSLVVHVRDGNRTQILYADILGVDDDQLVAWAQRTQEGRGLAESAWTRGGGVFDGINQFRSFRTKLESAGMVANTTRGYVLTGPGRSMVRRLVQYAADGETDDAPAWMADPRFNDEESLAAQGRARVLASE